MGADPLEAAAEAVLERLMPKIQEAAAKVAEAAQPTISRVIREDVAPWTIAGLVLGAAVAAAIGAYVATRRRS